MTVAQRVVNYLNQVGLAAKGAARGNVAGTDQRHAMAYASTVDLDEAYKVGVMAAAISQLVAKVDTWRRSCGLPARCTACGMINVPLAEVANSERTFPDRVDRRERNDVTDEFVRYCRPLIGDDMISLPMLDGRQRLARITPIFADKKLPEYHAAGGSEARQITDSRLRLVSSDQVNERV